MADSAAAADTGRGANASLEGITAISPRQVWAVGDISAGSSASRAYTLRWDGHSWRSVTVSGPAFVPQDRPMLSVTAFGHGQLAAVGYTNRPAGLGPVYSRWDGHRWSVVMGPRHGAVLGAVTTDGRSLWAVGSRDVSADVFVPFIQVSP